MASPQTENGYTKFANELLEQICLQRIPGQELRIVLYIARKTYGFGKTKDKMSYSQISNGTGIPRKRVADHVKSLAEKNILSVLNNGDRKPLTIQINKNYEKWQSVPKKGDIPKEGDRLSPIRGTKLSPIRGTTKETKEKKEIPSNFLDLSRRFHEHQKNNIGKAVNADTKTIEKGAGEIEKLVRLDGFDLENEVRPALQWAVQDDFWARQLLSLAAIRKKSKNGASKFQNLFAAYKANKPKAKKVDLVY